MPANPFQCSLLGENSKVNVPAASAVAGNIDDGFLRTYRLAMACTGEFSQFFLDGTEANDEEKKAKVLSAITTVIMRLNAVYENELSVHLNLIPSTENIIFLDPATDPYPDNLLPINTNSSNRAQFVIDSAIGDPNYDIGHLLDRTIDKQS